MIYINNLDHLLNFVIGSRIKYIYNCLKITYKGTKHL